MELECCEINWTDCQARVTELEEENRRLREELERLIVRYIGEIYKIIELFV